MRFRYQRMDSILGDFAKLEADGVTFVLATALSQQPYLEAEGRGGQYFYRPRDIGGFPAEFGIVNDELLSIMAHQYMIHIGDVAMSLSLLNFAWQPAAVRITLAASPSHGGRRVSYAGGCL